MKMKLKYFKWSPVGTIVLICNIGFLVAFIVSEGTFCKAAGFLGITMLFIARGIMWSGWWMEKNQALQEEIDELNLDLKRALRHY